LSKLLEPEVLFSNLRRKEMKKKTLISTFALQIGPGSILEIGSNRTAGQTVSIKKTGLFFSHYFIYLKYR
jgi:hypothetical protein